MDVAGPTRVRVVSKPNANAQRVIVRDAIRHFAVKFTAFIHSRIISCANLYLYFYVLYVRAHTRTLFRVCIFFIRYASRGAVSP